MMSSVKKSKATKATKVNKQAIEIESDEQIVQPVAKPTQDTQPTQQQVQPIEQIQMAKAAANYMNSQLIRMEAKVNGYSEGIALDVNGYVSEGSGENIFVVMNGAIHTPPLANSALPGITRDSVLTLCREAGISVTEQMLPREILYIADEVFFSGTAAEITPIRSIDRIKVGAGSRGPITKRIQDAFFSITGGKVPDRHGWLSPVGVTNGVAVR